MGTIPAQATGLHDDAVGGTDTRPEFADLAEVLQRYLALPSATGAGTSPCISSEDQTRGLLRITVLMTTQQEGYEEEVLGIARPILASEHAEVDILARVHLAVGRIHLGRTGEESWHTAHVHLDQAQHYAAALTGALYDLPLIVEIHTHLALALHRLEAVDDAIATMHRTRAIIDSSRFTDPSTEKDVNALYKTVAAKIGM